MNTNNKYIRRKCLENTKYNKKIDNENIYEKMETKRNKNRKISNRN